MEKKELTPLSYSWFLWWCFESFPISGLLSINCHIMLKWVPFLPTVWGILFLICLCHEKMLGFFYICLFRSLNLVTEFLTFVDLNRLNHPCLLGMKSTSSWEWSFEYCTIWFVHILLRIFAFIFHRKLTYIFLLCHHFAWISM